ncbi:MAG TPA: hypothetical protein VJ963_12970, partial [Bacteroidales bacterium]|nr:hypothetical protein [Bacteroidales bacterium]
ARLVPAEASFRNKDSLKKDASDITDQQFEYLCIAYMEGDLSAEQESEILSMTEKVPARKRTFDLIRQTKLTAPAVKYIHKRSLIRLTFVRKFAGTVFIVLSTAAAIALVVSLYFIVPRNAPGRDTRSSMKTGANDSVITINIKKGSPVILSSAFNTNPPVIKGKRAIKNKTGTARQAVAINETADSSLSEEPGRSIQVNRIAFTSDIDLPVRPVAGTLVAYNAPSIQLPDDEGDERSRIGKFIAKTFREKILREKTTSDAPLKAYEIAEAGVTGINKLLGWEMALNEKKDVNGEITSVYFSSKVLKFNAPVKKASPAP